MKIQQMQAIKDTRENLIGFLHFTDINKINELISLDVNKMRFYDICDNVMQLYKNKQINNKVARTVFEILMNENTRFKIKTYRHDNMYDKLFQYSHYHKAYLFEKRMTTKEFRTSGLANEYIESESN